MATDTTRVRSRRALLAGAAAGAAGVAVGHLGTPGSARAADLDHVVLGVTQFSTSTTNIQGGGFRIEGGELGAALITHGVGDRNAILASSVVEAVVTPTSTLGAGTAVDGQSGTGIGVRGYAVDGTGVQGWCSNAVGVHGVSDNGVGVVAESDAGRALDVVGKVTFSTADRGTISAGASRLTIEPSGGVSPWSIILVTLLDNPGGKKASAFSHVEPHVAAGTFDIVLTGPAARAVDVCYFVIG